MAFRSFLMLYLSCLLTKIARSWVGQILLYIIYKGRN